MKVVFDAIYAKFNTTNSFKTAVSSQFDPHTARQGTAVFPYAVYSMITHIPDRDFSHIREEFTFQISVFSQKKSPIEALTIGGYCTSLFDDCALTVTGYSQLYMVRESERIFRDDENNVWQWIVDYELTIEKAR